MLHSGVVRRYFCLMGLIGGFLGATTALSLAESADKDALQILTGFGAYKISQSEAFFKPYTSETGTKINAESRKGMLKRLRKWKEKSAPKADVVNLSAYEAETACSEGLLSSFGADDISPAPRGISLNRDFLGNSLMDCAVPTVAWSSLMAIKPGKFDKAKPRGWADFFNVKKFKGKRSLQKSARFTMEMAAMASGAKERDVYKRLGTIAGQKRAFAQLDKIKDSVLWWEDAAQSVENLRDDEVVMGSAYNGRLFNAIVGDGLNVQLVWQGQIYDYDYWGVPLNASKRAEAVAFVKYATAPTRLAAQSGWMPYGPMRLSSLAHVGEHKVGKMKMSPFIPTSRAHLKRALKFSETFWRSEEGKALEQRFADWADGDLVWPDGKE